MLTSLINIPFISQKVMNRNILNAIQKDLDEISCQERMNLGEFIPIYLSSLGNSLPWNLYYDLFVKIPVVVEVSRPVCVSIPSRLMWFYSQASFITLSHTPRYSVDHRPRPHSHYCTASSSSSNNSRGTRGRSADSADTSWLGLPTVPPGNGQN